MTTREEIIGSIQEMGYITITPRNISSSYYRLKDGTILEAHIEIESITTNPKQPDGYTIRSSNRTIAYVTKKVRNPEGKIPSNMSDIISGIIDDDVEAEPLLENYSVYELSNGLLLSIKTIVGQIKKTIFYTEQGEPVYSVSMSPVYKFKRPP